MLDDPPYTLRQLRHFLAVAELGSVTEGARRVHLSPSAMSASLTALERAVGADLIVRRPALGSALTPAGRHLALEAHKLLGDAQRILVEVGPSPDRIVGTVRVGVPELLAPVVVASTIKALAERHPDLELDIRLGDVDELVDRVANGDLDLTFAGVRLPDRFVSVELFTVVPHVLLPAGHRLATAVGVDLADLVAEPFILLDMLPGREHILQEFHGRSLVPDIRYRARSLELARSLVGQGLGYSVQAVRPWGDRSYEGRPLAVRPLVGLVTQPSPVVLGARADTRDDPRVQAVMAVAATITWPLRMVSHES